MAKTAISQLQDQIEAIRREAYAEGYAAAMQAIRDFAARPAGEKTTPAPRQRAAAQAAPTVTPSPTPAPTPRRRRGATRSTHTGRPQRGTNARLIAEVLKAMPEGIGRPADIRRALQTDKGVAMAFTSIRHALGQLATRNEVAASDDGKTWRYLGG